MSDQEFPDALSERGENLLEQHMKLSYDNEDCVPYEACIVAQNYASGSIPKLTKTVEDRFFHSIKDAETFMDQHEDSKLLKKHYGIYRVFISVVDRIK